MNLYVEKEWVTKAGLKAVIVNLEKELYGYLETSTVNYLNDLDYEAEVKVKNKNNIAGDMGGAWWDEEDHDGYFLQTGKGFTSVEEAVEKCEKVSKDIMDAFNGEIYRLPLCNCEGTVVLRKEDNKTYLKLDETKMEISEELFQMMKKELIICKMGVKDFETVGG